jgi:hypothetical protein
VGEKEICVDLGEIADDEDSTKETLLQQTGHGLKSLYSFLQKFVAFNLTERFFQSS